MLNPTSFKKIIGCIKKALCLFTQIIMLPLIFGQLGLGQQKPREKTKKTILNGLPNILLVCFLVFLEFLDNWTWDTKKPAKTKKYFVHKKILNGLAQDSSHRIDFSVLM